MSHAYDKRHASAQAQVGVLGRMDVRMVNILLLGAVVAALVGYLVLNNGVSTKGYSLRSLQARISDLEEERQKLDLAVVSGQSMGTIDGRIQGLGFVPVARVEYVGGGSGVAMR
ncbi:MAG: hypothetical protein RLZZ324_509 [Candidatus Parcubacteria bacterium]|jgi:hypothetical protein